MIRHCLFPSFNYSNLSDSWIYLITSPPDPNLGNPGGNNNPFANPDQAPVFVLDHFMLDQITGNPGAIPRDYAIVAIEPI